ncbi:IPT/TIG domain-containing protein [Flavobacterium sp. N502540]|uniref:IPT/TIG domain-containing protein n=1 Tax=Flavobacterium sp. N502540 TaxID=2986838 RepID=UPI0022252D1D|nr:IPT/TIG domain-containing protein [Flavobacterium sp. N502540]
MKKRILAVAVLQFFMVLGGCSSDSGNDSIPEPPVVVVKTPKITSYSKNSGESGETISIYGENFSETVNDIKITFDGVAATIVSTSATEIKVVLPQTESVLPKVVFTISGKKINNEVRNNYSGSIGIVPTSSKTAWFTMENVLKSDKAIKRARMLSSEISYITYGSYVYRTLDGGITWNYWAYNYNSEGDFYATKKGEGLCYTSFGASSPYVRGLIVIPENGDTHSETTLWKEMGGAYPGIPLVYIDENMQNGTIVSQRGVVYTNTKGGMFEMVYDSQVQNSDSNMSRIFMGAQIDNDHIWAVGEKKEGEATYPVILFKNNETDGWKQNLLKKEPGTYVSEVSFPDKENGFLLIKNAANTIFYKSINGGDTWTKVYTGEKFTKFAFKDGNTGWAILENKIYKTADGGVTWTLDYTHDQVIRTIICKDNVVWAISTDKIIKRYL